jgi:DNA-directed RNA polymerase specialized sigma subunit
MQSDKAREQTIMVMRATSHTFREIGKNLGISPQRVHQIVKRIERRESDKR